MNKRISSIPSCGSLRNPAGVGSSGHIKNRVKEIQGGFFGMQLRPECSQISLASKKGFGRCRRDCIVRSQRRSKVRCVGWACIFRDPPKFWIHAPSSLSRPILGQHSRKVRPHTIYLRIPCRTGQWIRIPIIDSSGFKNGERNRIQRCLGPWMIMEEVIGNSRWDSFRRSMQ